MTGNIGINSREASMINRQIADIEGSVRKLGDKAREVENNYRAKMAGTFSNWMKSIFSFGIRNIIHNMHHKAELENLSRCASQLHSHLEKLVQQEGGTYDGKITLLGGEIANLERKDNFGKVTLTFNTGKDEDDNEVVEIANPQDLLDKIEQDIMRNSDIYSKDLVLKIIDKYQLNTKDEATQHRKNLDEVIENGNISDNKSSYGFSAGPVTKETKLKVESNAARLNYVRKAILTHNREQCHVLLKEMFTSRLGLDSAEVDFIDRDMGLTIAKDVLDGKLKTGEDVRKFVNRNASENHFTTIENAKILFQLDKAQYKTTHDSHHYQSLTVHRTKDKIEAEDPNIKANYNAVSFKDGYYVPKDNPALPTGEEKAVHDFVSEIVSSENSTDHDLLKNKNGISSGQRLRDVFGHNQAMVGKLMQNRVDCKNDPNTKNLLATVNPDLRAALEEELDRLNAEFDKELNNKDTRYKNTEQSRVVYIKDLLITQQNKENSLKEKLGTQDLQELPDADLDDLSRQAQKDERDGGQISDLLNETGAAYISEDAPREKIQQGLNFFGQMEERLNKKIAESCQKLQNEVNEIVDDVFKTEIKAKKMSVEDVQNSTLGQIIGKPEEDLQMNLVKKVMKTYFAKMPVMDQRAMVAASIRFGKEGISKGAKLGALLKGAGPLMQKTLQGLDPSMFTNEDFKAALQDMKSKLAPISQRVIHAHLYDIVNKSNGDIKGITVVKALGAASVAQALKCVITKSDGTEVNCVVKILRPDATMRAQREFKIFNDAAKEIGNGMDKTFKGQYDSIMDELDLRAEAKNVVDGNKIYDYKKDDYKTQSNAENYCSFDNVHSMKLVEGIETTKNVMVLEEVKGGTLDSYLKDTSEEAISVANKAREDMKTQSAEKQSQTAAKTAEKLQTMYMDMQEKYKSLVNLAYMWTNEGLFAEGFYHGDVHKGNLMVNYGWKDVQEGNPLPKSDLTLIDFGNATHLNKNDKNSVVKVVAGAASGFSDLMLDGFKKLLSAESAQKLSSNEEEIRQKLDAILAKGTLNDTAARLNAFLAVIQKDYQIEVPAAIHNFIESQRRMQVALEETASIMKSIQKDRDEFVKKISSDDLKTDEVQTVTQSIELTSSYKPVSMVKCLVDVVKQHAKSALMAIGSSAINCARKITADVKRLEEIEKQQAQAPAEDISSQNASPEQLLAMGGQLS
ncbi:MAG: AarF/UbiB family protein [Succinivibrio sp.]